MPLQRVCGVLRKNEKELVDVVAVLNLKNYIFTKLKFQLE